MEAESEGGVLGCSPGSEGAGDCFLSELSFVEGGEGMGSGWGL